MGRRAILDSSYPILELPIYASRWIDLAGAAAQLKVALIQAGHRRPAEPSKLRRAHSFCLGMHLQKRLDTPEE